MRARNILAILPVTAAMILGGCASSTTRTAVSEPRTAAPITTASVPTSPTHGAGSTPASLEPLSGGTECVVSYEGAFVVFKSTGYDVSAACSAQIRAGAAEGQHWTYPTGGQVSGDNPVCTLSTAMAMATVYDTADTIGQGACRGLIRAGWTKD